MAANDLPLGYKFEPSKEELVGYFLTTKLSNQPLDPFYKDVMIDFDVYSDHPSNIMALTNRKVEEDGFQQGYFFSSLKKTSKNGKRINRHIPTHGTWSEKAGTKMVSYQNGEVIGILKYYKFNADSKSKGSMLNIDEWMMHEYSLSDNQDQDNNMVLCHITNKKKSLKSTEARKINMVVDESLDYEAASPSKRSRVDPPYTECIDDLLRVIISHNAGDRCAPHGYKSAQEYHQDGDVIGIPAGEMAPTSNIQEELDRLEALLMA